MGTYNASDIKKQQPMSHVYGNVSHITRGVAVPSGAAIAATVDFIRLRKNFRIVDFMEWHDGGNSGATTANFGLAAVEGGLTTQEDADYFLAAADLNAVGRNRWGNAAVAPLILDDDYYVRAVLAGAATATAAMTVWVTVWYEFIGNL